MNEVLYTHDMEPITIIPIGPALDFHLRTHRSVYVPVIPEIQAQWRGMPVGELAMKSGCHKVHITCDWFQRNGVRHRFLFTHDETAALLLRPEFLPGQQKQVQRRERDSFAKGFLHAVRMLG